MDDGKRLPEIDNGIDVLGVPVGLNIDYLSLRYLNEDRTWVDSWDSSQPPVAVELALRGYDSVGIDGTQEENIDPQWFLTTVKLRE